MKPATRKTPRRRWRKSRPRRTITARSPCAARLGLLLSEIGQSNGIEITAQEFQMLVSQAAQQYRPEDRQRFAEYVQSEPMVAAQLRAPLYEEKVVDFLFDKADVTTREVTKEELQAAIEAEEGAAGMCMAPIADHDHDHKPAAKKKAAPKKEG
jgi:trigger factor